MSLSSAPPLADLAAAARRGLEAAWGRAATLVVAAPGRVNLIGEHVDYCDGFVLPFALDRAVVIAAAVHDRPEVRIASASGAPATIALDRPVERGLPAWTNYVRGVIRGFQDRGAAPPGFDAWVVSSLPAGAGLSSSAALECAAAVLLDDLAGTRLDARTLALACQRAEHEFAGVPCGIMDQMASLCGAQDHLVFLDCRSGTPTLVPFAAPDLTVLVADTRVRHDLAAGGYATRRRETERALALLGAASWRDVTAAAVAAARDRLGDPLARRSRHVVGEIARTAAAAAALAAGDAAAAGALMDASHDSLRDDFEVSCRELDLLVASARALGGAGGVCGARMTGGGFGGSAVVLCRRDRTADVAARLAADFRAAVGHEPDVFASRPAAGARVLWRRESA